MVSMQVLPRLRCLLVLTALVCLVGARPLRAGDSLAKYAGVYHGETRTKEETRAQSNEGAYAIRHHTITLSLGKDGGATLTESPDAVSETTRFGHWSYAAGLITVRLDPPPDGTTKGPTRGPTQRSGQEGTEEPTPVTGPATGSATETFSVNHHELTPVTWDHQLWKTLPPPKMQRE
jgi:hypothetical protein